jgi:predicted ATPase
VDVVGTSASLLDKSLIRRRTTANGIVKFSMTEGIREFAAQQLSAHAEVASIRSRHAGFFAAEARRAEEGVGTADETKSTEWASREQGNMLAALGYCLEARDLGQALYLAAALGWNWYLRGRVGESESTLEQVLISRHLCRPGF